MSHSNALLESCVSNLVDFFELRVNMHATKLCHTMVCAIKFIDHTTESFDEMYSTTLHPK